MEKIKKHKILKLLSLFVGSFLLLLIIAFNLKITPSQFVLCYYHGMSNSHITYQISDNILKIDTASNYSLVSKNDYKPIASKQILFESLSQDIKIPLRLLLKNRKKYGCPDCIDQGGILLKFNVVGIEKVFFIDPNQKESFDEDFLNELNTKIDKIKGY